MAMTDTEDFYINKILFTAQAQSFTEGYSVANVLPTAIASVKIETYFESNGIRIENVGSIDCSLLIRESKEGTLKKFFKGDVTNDDDGVIPLGGILPVGESVLLEFNEDTLARKREIVQNVGYVIYNTYIEPHSVSDDNLETAIDMLKKYSYFKDTLNIDGKNYKIGISTEDKPLGENFITFVLEGAKNTIPNGTVIKFNNKIDVALNLVINNKFKNKDNDECYGIRIDYTYAATSAGGSEAVTFYDGRGGDWQYGDIFQEITLTEAYTIESEEIRKWFLNNSDLTEDKLI